MRESPTGTGLGREKPQYLGVQLDNCVFGGAALRPILKPSFPSPGNENGCGQMIPTGEITYE